MNLDDALYVHIVYRNHGHEVYSEVVCRRCFEESRARGMYDVLRQKHGQSIRMTPWIGTARCDGCEVRARG
jgi:hypothetical protein